MIKTVINSSSPEITTIDDINSNQLVVGIASGGLVFSVYKEGYAIRGTSSGLLANWAPCGYDKFNSKFETIRAMFKKCIAVYAVDNWQDVADIAKMLNVKEF